VERFAAYSRELVVRRIGMPNLLVTFAPQFGAHLGIVPKVGHLGASHAQL